MDARKLRGERAVQRDTVSKRSGRGSIMVHEAFPGNAAPRTVPQQRIVEKLDDYMSHRDYAEAERHLRYWLDEALALGDKRGELMVRNELIGHFRKTGNKEGAFTQVDAALRLVDELGFAQSISAGTTYTNAATALSAFGENERSLALFERAAELYEASEHTQPRLLGGLYNNMALACIALGKFSQADALYEKALGIMAGVENGELEQAITYLNMADAAVAKARAAAGSAAHAGAEAGVEAVGAANAAAAETDASAADALEAEAACEKEVERLLDTALTLLDTSGIPRDGYYAFVCEKCAPTFAHYGYFLADADLRERARAIYERA